MTKPISLKRNALMNALLTISSVVFPLITFPYVSRILLPTGTGKVSLATSVISYFTMFAQLGIPTYGIRACAKVRNDKIELTRVTHELLIINICTCILSYIILAIAITVVPQIRNEKTLYIVMSTSIFLNAVGMEWMYKGLEQYTYITVRSVIFKLISVIAMFLLVKAESDYVYYGAITVFASSASLLLNFINARKYIFIKPVGGYQIKRHMKPVMVFFAMSCATIIYVNLDEVMLGFIKAETDVGYYNVAVKIRTLLLHIVTSLGAVLLPRVTYYIDNGLKDQFEKIAKRTLHFVVVASSAMCIYFTIYSLESVLFISGNAYIPSVVPMQVIMPTLILAGISNITGIQMLIPLGREKDVLYSEILGAITDLILNATLIPYLSSVGAAIGTLVAEIVVLVYQLLCLRKKVNKLFDEIPMIRIAFALAIASMVSLGIKLLTMGSVYKLIISAVLFFGVYGLALFVLKDSIMQVMYTTVRRKIKKES